MVEKRRYAFFVNSLNSGGIENYLLRFLKHYDGQFNCTVYCKSGILGDLEENYKTLNARIISYRFSYFNLRQIKQLAETLKIEKYNAVCDFTGNFSGSVLLAAYLGGIKKRIVFYRGSSNHFHEDILRLSFNHFMKLMVKAFATDILSNSISALNFFFPSRDKSSTKFEVIYNGIDSNKFVLGSRENLRIPLGIPDCGFVIGHVGRYNPAKNHQTIINVAIELCKIHDDIYFVICGDKVDSSLSSIITNNGLSNRIKLLGYRSDVIQVLNTLDCFYFPSLTEGQPNALIEAMICGLPFVASNIDPIRETVPETHHSQLIPPLSKEMAMVKLLQLYNKEITINIADWARKNFNHEFWFDKFYLRLKG